MTIKDVFELMEEIQYSPEQLGKLTGISGMTIRRWTKQDTSTPVPQLYRLAFISTVLVFVSEGKLKPDASIVPRMLNGKNDLLKLKTGIEKYLSSETSCASAS